MSQTSSSFGSTPMSLLGRLKSRDRGAWYAFCDLYAPLVYHWCRSSGLTHDQAEDVSQQVFSRLASSIERFEKRDEMHRFRAWLWTLTRRLILDLHRNQSRRIKTIGGKIGSDFIANQADCRVDSDLDLPADSDAMTSQGENRQLFLRMVEQVRERHSERNWQAFWRVVVDGSTSHEVAEELGMTVNYVRQVKCRVLRQLREEFGELLD